MMIEDTLMKLEFSPSEIKVYIFLINTGSNYVTKISSGTKLNRTNIYEALERLISKGLVASIIKNKVKCFEAKKPESIVSLVKQKEEEYKIIKKQLANDIRSIRSINTIDKNPLEATIFVGKKGLRILFEEILETSKPISLIAAELQFKDFFGPYFELWHKLRIKRKIKQRSIFPKIFKNKLKKRKFLEYRFVDNKFVNPTTTIIYGDYCLFIQWSKEPVAIKIQNKEITKSHLNYFNMLWYS